jgi:KipI family sensor histidine kinase inhibitor
MNSMNSMNRPRVLPAGDGAALLEFDTADEVAAAHRSLSALESEGIVELVPAARTILVIYDATPASPEKFADAAWRAEPVEAAASLEPTETPDEVHIPVTYDGPDLPALAQMTGLSVAEIVERHAAPLYVVAFCGFAPGFAYLNGLDPLLRLARRDTPRTRVPAGSVAVADEFTGVYPNASPGGWHLLGRTDAVLWDVDRDPPALLAPGTRVRFRPVGAAP